METNFFKTAICILGIASVQPCFTQSESGNQTIGTETTISACTQFVAADKTDCACGDDAQEMFTFYGSIKNCNDTTPGAEIFIKVTGGHAPYSYAWSNGKTTKDLLCISEGDYVLTVTDATGRKICDLFHIEETTLCANLK